MREESRDNNLKEAYRQENLRLLQEIRKDLNTIDPDTIILTYSEREKLEELETRYERLIKQASPERDSIEWLHGQILLFKNEIEKLNPVPALHEFDSYTNTDPDSSADTQSPLTPLTRTSRKTKKPRAFLSNTIRVPALPAVEEPQPHEQIFTDAERLGSLTTPFESSGINSSSGDGTLPVDDEADFSGIDLESDPSPLPSQSTEPLPNVDIERQHIIELQHSLHRLVSELNVYPKELFRPEERSQIDASEYAADPHIKIPPDKVNFFNRLLESHIKELSRIKEELYIRIFRTFYDPMERQITVLKNSAPASNEYIQNQIQDIEKRLEALTLEAGKIMTNEVLQKVKDLNRDIRNLEDLLVQKAVEDEEERKDIFQASSPREAESEEKIIADIYIYRSQIREILKKIKHEEDQHTTLLRQIRNLFIQKNFTAANTLLQRTLAEFDESDFVDESTSQLKEIKSLLDEKNYRQAEMRATEIVNTLETKEDENTTILDAIQDLLDQANYTEARHVAKTSLEGLKKTQEYQEIEETMKKESWLHTSKETIDLWTDPQKPAIPGAFGGKCFSVLGLESKISGQIHYFYKISEDIPSLSPLEAQIPPDVKIEAHYYRVLPHILEGEEKLNLLVSFKKEGNEWTEDVRKEDKEQMSLFNERWMQLDEKELEAWLKGTPLKDFQEDYLVVTQIYDLVSGEPLYFCKFTNTPSKIQLPQGVKGKLYTLPLRKELNPLAIEIRREFNELKDGESYKNNEPQFVRILEKPHEKRQIEYPPAIKALMDNVSFAELQFFLDLAEIYNERGLEHANALIQETCGDKSQNIIQKDEALRVIEYLQTSLLELRWPRHIKDAIKKSHQKEKDFHKKQNDKESILSEITGEQEFSEIPEESSPLTVEAPTNKTLPSQSEIKSILGWSRIATAVLALFVGVASYFVKGLREDRPQKAAVMKIRVTPREDPEVTYVTEAKNPIPQEQLPALEYLDPDTSSDIKTEHLAASPKELQEKPALEQSSQAAIHELQIAQKGQSISSSVIDDLVKNHHIPRKLALKEVGSYIIKNTLPWLVHEGDTIRYTFTEANGQFSLDSISHTKKGEEKQVEPSTQEKAKEKGEIRIGQRTFKAGETIDYLPTNKQPGKYTVIGLSTDGQKLLLKSADNPRLPQFAVNIENLQQRIPGAGNETFTIDGLWMEKLTDQVYKIRFSTTSGKGVTKALATLILHEEYKDDKIFWKRALDEAQEAVRKANSSQEIPDSETNMSYLKIPDLVIPGKDHIVVSKEAGAWAIKQAHFTKEKSFQIE